MATEVYQIGYVKLINGVKLEITPLKIKYMRQFMKEFDKVSKSSTDLESIEVVVNCAAITMQQYSPDLASPEAIEDNMDLPEIYNLLEYSAGIKLNDQSEKTVAEQKNNQENSWEKLDLAKLESEAFLLGIWKDFDELERSLSMPELVAVLGEKRELDYNERKFLAALQGVDLDKQGGGSNQNAWEEMKARVFSNGKASDANDIVSFQGSKATKAGFGIGMGLDYVDMTTE